MAGISSGRFSVPRSRPSTVERKRLTGRLHGAIGDGLILLHAPAGFGKTTLLTSFVRELEYNVRWLTLDSSCASPEVFAQHLATAFNGAPEAPAPATAEKLDDLRAYLDACIRDAHDASPLPLLIVIDNVHELADHTETAEILGWMLETLPESSEVVLAGRSLAPLNVIDQRIATGDCLLLESADLAFTEDETRALLPADRAREAAEVQRGTDGWPAGVMAVVCGSLRNDNVTTRSRVAWEQYLNAEVWSAVPASLRPHVLRLAVPPTVDRQLATSLLGADAWRETEAWLGAHDFLFEHLADDGIRFNPLFRQFLLGLSRKEQPETFAAEAERIALLLEESGQLPEAIELARDARLRDSLLALAERHSRALIASGQFALLKRVYSGIGHDELEGAPMLRAMRARVLAHTGKPAEALDEAAATLDDSATPVAARIQALLARQRALRLLGRSSELGETFSELHEIGDLPDAQTEAEIRYHEAQWVLPASSDFNHAEELLVNCLDACRSADSPTLELLARSTLGQLLAMRGDCPAAVTELTRAAQGWRRMGRTSNLGWVLNNLGMAHIAVGDFDAAAEALSEAVREANACENQRNLAYATASLGDAELARAEYDAAKGHFEEAIRICSEEVPDETLAALSIAGLAAAFLGLGDQQQADYFSERALFIAEAVGTPFELGTCLVTHAAVKSATSNADGAIEAASAAVQLFRDIGAVAPLRTALYRLAVCHFRAGQRDEARAALGELKPTVTEAWTLGSLIPLLREDPMFAQWVAARGVLGPSFRDLLDHQTFTSPEREAEEAVAPAGRFPRVVAESLGRVRVAIDGRDVTDEQWASAKSKELFFLFLARKDGLRKEEAVVHLYPDLEPEKCNSAFHSNLYRVRRALYQDSVVKRDGTYMLNPDAQFDWDVSRFEEAMQRAGELPAGSSERAAAYRSALEMYRGPFGESFYSEWADTLRTRTSGQAQHALSTLGGYYAGSGDFESAAQCMEALLERSGGVNEEAAFQLAVYRARGGQPAAALAFIDRYARTQRAEFGADLPGRFRELRSKIASGIAV